MKFTISTELKASTEKVYNSWLSSKEHSAMTGSHAQCSKRINSKFSASDGYITGKTLALEPNVYIKQSWRTTEFEVDQPDSLLEIKLKQLNKDHCKITLIHSNLQAKDGHYKQGWLDYYFEPMRDYFSQMINP